MLLAAPPVELRELVGSALDYSPYLSPIEHAALFGDIGRVTTLLAGREEQFAARACNIYVYSCSVRANNRQVAEYLLSAAEVTNNHYYPDHPLNIVGSACERGRVEILELVLAQCRQICINQLNINLWGSAYDEATAVVLCKYQPPI